LARQFLSLGDDVVITSRSVAAVEEAQRKLRQEFPGCQVVGVAADVSQAADVERLATKAVQELGQIVRQAASKDPLPHNPYDGLLLCAPLPSARKLRQSPSTLLPSRLRLTLCIPPHLMQDIWVQNAALSAATKAPVASTPPAELTAVVATNLGGALLGARAAIARMTTQPGGGKFFLVDGNGR
jgi:NAD(P)-dependent dehydrogenase (short-subunit alcohol dehydrogenase family)